MPATLFPIPPDVRARQKAIKKALIDLDMTVTAFADYLGRTRGDVSKGLGTSLRRVTDPEGIIREMEAGVKRLAKERQTKLAA